MAWCCAGPSRVHCPLKGPVGTVVRVSLAKLCALMRLRSRQPVGLSLDDDRMWLGGGDDGCGCRPELAGAEGGQEPGVWARELQFSCRMSSLPKRKGWRQQWPLILTTLRVGWAPLGHSTPSVELGLLVWLHQLGAQMSKMAHPPRPLSEQLPLVSERVTRKPSPVGHHPIKPLLASFTGCRRSQASQVAKPRVRWKGPSQAGDHPEGPRDHETKQSTTVPLQPLTRPPVSHLVTAFSSRLKSRILHPRQVQVQMRVHRCLG